MIIIKKDSSNCSFNIRIFYIYVSDEQYLLNKNRRISQKRESIKSGLNTKILGNIVNFHTYNSV